MFIHVIRLSDTKSIPHYSAISIKRSKQARQIAGDLVKAGLIEERRLNRAEWFVAVEHVGEQP